MIILSVDQEDALDEALAFLLDDDPKNNEMSISGPAGTGKTVLTRHLLEAARKQKKMLKLLTEDFTGQLTIHLTSTTNKAARVLADATGEEAGTIHSLLGLRVVNNYNTGKTQLKKSGASKVIQNAIIIIDEGSMANEELLQTIRDSTHNCKVIYIGDSYQLAPVFENSCPVFSKITKQSKLTTIQRQASHSSIIQFANQFRSALDTGVFPEIKTHGHDVILLDGPEFKALAQQEFTNMPTHNHARMVAWTNNRVHQYNDYLRHLNVKEDDYQVGESLLTNNPILKATGQMIFSTDSIAEITHIEEDERHDIKGWNITLDDRVEVFQAKNQHQVNAFLKKLAGQAKRDGKWVHFFNAKESFADLRPIYACTVNKAQGSTYRSVFIDLDDIARNNKNSEIARLMYTAVTRASDKVYMYGLLPGRLYG